MKLLFMIGNAAVGKMTVGQELMKLTGLRLFHNHMTIEPVIEIFGQYNGKAINRLRQVVFEEFAKSDCYGMIFTYMWAFDQKADWDCLSSLYIWVNASLSLFCTLEKYSFRSVSNILNPPFTYYDDWENCFFRFIINYSMLYVRRSFVPR